MAKETARVEVQRDGAWMEATVVVAYGHGRGLRYKVRYDHQPDHYGQPLTEEEDVPFTRVRPIPPHKPYNYSYSIHDAVEVYDKGCWWQGIITRVAFVASEFFVIYFPCTDIYKTYHCSKLRPAQEWFEGKWSPLRSQQTRNIIHERKYPMVATSGMTSIASSPWDMQTNAQSETQTNAQSEREFETEVKKQRKHCDWIEEVKKKRKHCDWIENRATLDVADCFSQAIRSRDTKPKKAMNKIRIKILKKIETSLIPHSKGVKRVYVHDGRQDQTYGGSQDEPRNDAKRFKHTEPEKAKNKIRIRILKKIETSAESLIGNTARGYFRTEFDKKPRRNNCLNVVAEQGLEAHDRELQAYRLVLKAFYAQPYLTWEQNNLLSSLRQELHITTNEYTDELKKLISES